MSFLDFTLVPLITLSNIGIIGIISFKNRRSKLHTNLAIFIGCLASWILFAFLSEAIAGHGIKIFFSRLTYISVELAVLFFINFVYIFIGRKLRRVTKIVGVLFVSILTFITLFSDQFISDIKYTESGFDIIFGPYYKLFFIIVLLFLFGIIQLVIKYFTAERNIKEQIRYFLFGFLIFAVTNIFINVVVRQITDSDEYYRIGNYSIIVFIFFTAYAIIKYRLMNIKFVIGRSLLYIILVALISSAFVFISTLIGRYFEQFVINQYFIWAIFAFIIVIGLDPLKHGFAHITDRVFFKNQIDYRAELKQLSALINEEVALHALIKDLRLALMQRIKLKSADILIANEDNKQYQSHANRSNLVTLDQTEPLVQYLNRHQETLVTDEFDRYIYNLVESDANGTLRRILTTLTELKAGAVVPIIRDAKITALLIIGQKNSGENFSAEDINLFEVIASQLAAALQRSRLYEQVQAFNVQLQKEVDKATAQLQQTNAELHLANEHLKELDSAKSEFISIASHQLRTPLAGITGYLSMILEGDYGKLNPQLNQVIKDIFEAGQRLVRLVNSFLDITKIEAGRISLNFSKVNLVELVAAEAHELKPTADKKGISLVLADPTQTDMMVEIDADKIRDVCLNLIDNAIKYTDHGTVTVALALQGPDHAHFWVQDTGVGIDLAKAHSLFQKFFRGTGIARVQPDGSGLGLFIVKKIVEAHHGKIWVDSAGPEQGSTFHVVLPLTQP